MDVMSEFFETLQGVQKGLKKAWSLLEALENQLAAAPTTVLGAPPVEVPLPPPAVPTTAPTENLVCPRCGFIAKSKAGYTRHINSCQRQAVLPTGPMVVSPSPPAPPVPPAPSASPVPPAPPAVAPSAPAAVASSTKFTAPQGAPSCYGKEHNPNLDKCLICPWEIGCQEAQGS